MTPLCHLSITGAKVVHIFEIRKSLTLFFLGNFFKCKVQAYI